VQGRPQTHPYARSSDAFEKRHVGRHIFGNQVGKKLHEPAANDHACKTSRQCQQESFRHKLTHQSRRRGTSAPLTAISRLRLSERTSTRLATLTHAIKQQQPGPAQQSEEDGSHVASDDL